ncbi:MAG: hypothetical protein V1733_08470, partial [bacterium]
DSTKPHLIRKIMKNFFAFLAIAVFLGISANSLKAQDNLILPPGYQVDTGGETVYERREIEVQGELNLSVQAGHLPQASYLLEVANETGTLYTKVIIQK